MSTEPLFGPEQLPAPEAQDWYFTFGAGQFLFAAHANGEDLQTHHDGIPLEHRYVVISGTFAEARARMYQVFGPMWSDQYSDFKSFASYYPVPPRKLEI